MDEEEERRGGEGEGVTLPPPPRATLWEEEEEEDRSFAARCSLDTITRLASYYIRTGEKRERRKMSTSVCVCVVQTTSKTSRE